MNWDWGFPGRVCGEGGPEPNPECGEIASQGEEAKTSEEAKTVEYIGTSWIACSRVRCMERLGQLWSLGPDCEVLCCHFKESGIHYSGSRKISKVFK